MGAFTAHKTGHDIQRWIEVWDYASDAIYRGFVAEQNGERTMFVFFDRALDHGLKSGYVTLCVPMDNVSACALGLRLLGHPST